MKSFKLQFYDVFCQGLCATVSFKRICWTKQDEFRDLLLSTILVTSFCAIEGLTQVGPRWSYLQELDMIGKTAMVDSFNVSLSSSFIRKKLSTIPVLPIMSLFN